MATPLVQWHNPREVAVVAATMAGGRTEWGTLPYSQRALVREPESPGQSALVCEPRGMIRGSSTPRPKCHTSGQVAVMAGTLPAGSVPGVAAMVNAALARERAAALVAAVAARGHPGSCSRCSPSHSR